MGIKRRLQTILTLILIFCLLFPTINTVSNTRSSGPIIKTSAPEFPDKVYAFLAPSDILTFEDLYFEEHYTYFIWVEIVTPHNCTLTITLWDPEGKQFDLFASDVYLEPEGKDYHEIPFGCAIGGNHTIEFTTISSVNLNIYIRIEKWVKCLYDKILSEELQDMILYDVVRFQDGMMISPAIEFRTDYLYRFYFGRVSAISATQSNFVSLNFTLFDPDAIDYIMYTDETLPTIVDVSFIYFGTATEGEYTLDIEVKSDVVYTNIAYAVIELHKISHVIDPNQTDPTNSTSSPTNIFHMPIEWTVGLLAFFGVIITAIIIIVAKNKNKNVASFRKRIEDDNQD